MKEVISNKKSINNDDLNSPSDKHDYATENSLLKKEIENLKKTLKINKENSNNNTSSNLNLENENLKKEVDSLKKIIKSYEQKNLKTTELEKIIRNQQSKYDKQIEDIESNYREKIKYINKQLFNRKDAKTKEIIIDDIENKSVINRSKVIQGQSSSLSKNTDKGIRKENSDITKMMHNSSSSTSNMNKSKRVLEKKSSMENINSNMIKKLHNSKINCQVRDNQQ